MWPEDVQHHQRPLNLIDAQALARTDLPYLQRAEALPVARAVKVLLHREVDEEYHQWQAEVALTSRNDMLVAQELGEIAEGVEEDMMRARRLRYVDDGLEQEESTLDGGLLRREGIPLTLVLLV